MERVNTHCHCVYSGHGAGTIADPTRTAVALNKYVKEAPFQDPEQSPFMTSIHVLKDDPNFEV